MYMYVCLSRLMKQRAWEAVAKSPAARSLNLVDPKACQTKFKTFRDQYVRLKRELANKQPRSGSGVVCLPAPTWHLWDAMGFLANVVKRRQTTSNFNESKCIF